MRNAIDLSLRPLSSRCFVCPVVPPMRVPSFSRLSQAQNRSQEINKFFPSSFNCFNRPLFFLLALIVFRFFTFPGPESHSNGKFECSSGRRFICPTGRVAENSSKKFHFPDHVQELLAGLRTLEIFFSPEEKKFVYVVPRNCFA